MEKKTSFDDARVEWVVLTVKQLPLPIWRDLGRNVHRLGNFLKFDLCDVNELFIIKVKICLSCLM